jgi:hypothetical protein
VLRHYTQLPLHNHDVDGDAAHFTVHLGDFVEVALADGKKARQRRRHASQSSAECACNVAACTGADAPHDRAAVQAILLADELYAAQPLPRCRAVPRKRLRGAGSAADVAPPAPLLWFLSGRWLYAPSETLMGSQTDPSVAPRRMFASNHAFTVPLAALERVVRVKLYCDLSSASPAGGGARRWLDAATLEALTEASYDVWVSKHYEKTEYHRFTTLASTWAAGGAPSSALNAPANAAVAAASGGRTLTSFGAWCYPVRAAHTTDATTCAAACHFCAHAPHTSCAPLPRARELRHICGRGVHVQRPGAGVARVAPQRAHRLALGAGLE